MSAVEVHVSVGGITRRAGTLHFRDGERGERVSFEYRKSWLADPERFPVSPDLPLEDGEFKVRNDRLNFGSFRDATPDSWGRTLLDRAERLQAKTEGRSPEALPEADVMLGARDESRHGALRFRVSGGDGFLAAADSGVPSHSMLGQLLESVAGVERNEETEEDLRLLLEAGSSLGGARPKASVIDPDGNLAIAKFPRSGDWCSVETWEHIALTLAREAGIVVAEHRLLNVGGKTVLLSRRFDREGDRRIPFMSAKTMLRAKVGERGSYPQIVDALSLFGEQTKKDSAELYRRMVFNIMVTNTDDHLRNHGFLMTSSRGWVLSPAYDINPEPYPANRRVLCTKISPENGACSLKLALDQAGLFGLHKDRACAIAGEVAAAVSKWKEVASSAG